MKTMFRLPQMLGAIMLLSCTTDIQPEQQVQTPTTPTVGVTEPPVTPNNNFTDVLPSMYPFSDNAHFIKGQISANSNLDINTLFMNKITTPNLGDIIKVGEKVNMVAMGGGMTAGVRNGGLYRAGQMTAYPNLVARQMGITDFQSPLFAENEANGTGYLQLVDDGTAYPSWKEVSNSKATVKAGSPPELPKYIGGTVNNYALPGGASVMGNKINNLGVNDFGRSWFTGQVFASRILPSKVDVSKVSLMEQMLKQSINFFIIEDDSDFLLDLIKYNGNSLSSYGYQKSMLGPTTVSGLIRLMQDADPNLTKGIIFTTPIISDLAYFNWYSIQDLKNKAKNVQINTSRNNESFTLDGSKNNFLLLPTPTVDALFRNLKKGDEVSVTLADTDILDPSEFLNNTVSFKLYNDKIREIAKNKGLALVDLEKIYNQIHSNTYVSSDGFRIDGSPKGNFFSADGVYPTAIGQAVIANEVIKSINATYKSSIPLINLKDYNLMVGKE
jgi:hypothetical protein